MFSVTAHAFHGESFFERVGTALCDFFSLLADQRRATERYGDLAHIGQAKTARVESAGMRRNVPHSRS